jgi:hypothetical protein
LGLTLSPATTPPDFGAARKETELKQVALIKNWDSNLKETRARLQVSTGIAAVPSEAAV